MANVSYKLKDLEKRTIKIGYVGENDHMHVLIDCKEAFDEYPNAVVTMAIVPPEGEDYPKAVTRTGNIVEWLVKNSDVAAEGDGEFQLTFTEDNVVKKSVTGRFSVERSISGNGTAPSGIDDFLTDANEKLAEVEAATQEAENAARHAPRVGASGYWEVWDAETEQYVSTGTKAQGEQGDPGSPGDPTQLIDDTAGQGTTGKTWSADKLDDQFGSVLTAIHGVEEDVETKYEKPNSGIPSSDMDNSVQVTLADVGKKAPVIERQASGDFVVVNDGFIDKPLLSCVAQVEPVQSGSGEPSAINIRPFIGFTDCELIVCKNNIFSASNPNIINGYIEISQHTIWQSGVSKTVYMRVEQNTKYIVSKIQSKRFVVALTDSNTVGIDTTLYGEIQNNDGTEIEITTGSNTKYMAIWLYASNHDTLTLDEILASLKVVNGNSYTVSWQSIAGTLYGCTVDVTSGKVKKEWERIESYNGETLPDIWLSDRDVYEEGTTPTSGAEVVYKLSEPVEYDIQSQQIYLFPAYNKIFSKIGSVSVKYYADTKNYIDVGIGCIVPELYGAAGDGIEDDTEALEKAIIIASETGKSVVGFGTYKVNNFKVNTDGTKLILNKIVSDGDALTVLSAFNSIQITRIESNNGNGIVVRGSHNTIDCMVISAYSKAIRVYSNNDSACFNKITAHSVFGSIGIELDYTNAQSITEWVNENIFNVWSFHCPVGIHINGASTERSNANVFNDPDFELCTTAGIVIDGETQYNRFINCRNEEVDINRVLIQVNGTLLNSVIDCKTAIFPANLSCSQNCGSNIGAYNIITNGIKEPHESIMWPGQVAFVTNNHVPCIFPLTKLPNRALYAESGKLDPRTNPDMARCSALISNGADVTIELGEDYGRLLGTPPVFIVAQNEKIIITKNNATIATLTNTTDSLFVEYHINWTSVSDVDVAIIT